MEENNSFSLAGVDALCTWPDQYKKTVYNICLGPSI